MKAITHNPYRILGMFANDPIRTQTANISRIRAFNKVGKDCFFDSDFTDIFGPINRSDQSLEHAISLLATESSQDFYSCLWIHRTESLNTEAKAEPDFVKYEIQLYSQLGYDLDIETPYYHYYLNLPSIYNRFPKLKEKNDKIKCFCFNLIDDTYTRPLSIYYHPKIIFLSCFIFTIKFLDLNDYIDIDKLIEGENLDLIGECMENINSIYAKYVENNN